MRVSAVTSRDGNAIVFDPRGGEPSNGLRLRPWLAMAARLSNIGSRIFFT